MKNNNISNNRIDVADVLRGFAVMGIILLHSIEHFNFYAFPDTTNQGEWLNFTDRAVWDGLFFLFGGKGYAIFSLLFGFSFFIMDDNQRRQGKDFRLRFCWRMALLFLLGNLNASFFTGEVLVLYSIVGFILPLTCRLNDKWLLCLASIMLVQPLALYFVVRACLDSSYTYPTIPSDALWGAAYQMQSGGTFWETVRVNLWEGQLASLSWAWDNGRVFQTAALFLFGLLIGRRGLFRKEHRPFWNKALLCALAAFFPLYGLSNMLPDFISNKSILTPLLLVVSSLHKFAFTLILVSSIIYIYYEIKGGQRLMLLAPYGRMSLTNYITQSIVGSMIFYNWGFGMFRYLGITASVCVGALLFLLQLSFCHWWMRNHRHGPFEYLWKKATWIGRKTN
ncbi:MAG: DUF418 domain-containing protein [Prevotellaceae bacterium]|nr:DUF418 domain-containing protein [Prevotellaceae bacterium]